MTKKIRISIKFKVFSLVTFLVFFALAMIILQTSRVFKADKEDFVKEMNAKLTSSTAKSVADRVANIQDKLVVFISSKESLARTRARVSDQNLVLFARYPEFNSISLMKANSSDSLKLEWLIRNPNGDATKWVPDLEKDFIKNLNMKTAYPVKRWFWKMPTADGSWQSLLGFGVDVVDKKEVGKKKKNSEAIEETVTNTYWIFGVMPPNLLEDSLRDFTTGISTASIVDEDGVVIATSDSKLKSRNLLGLPLVAEALQKKRPSGTGDFVDQDNRPIIGSFENIPKMNLSIIVTTPQEKAFEAAAVIVRNILFIGLIVLVAAIALAIILSNYMTKPLQNLAKIAAKIGAGDFNVPIDVKTNDEIGDLAESFAIMEAGLQERDSQIEHSKMALVQSEKMSAFGQLSAGIAHEVKNPLAGILGHAQLAMGKLKDDDIKKHLEVIEKETRRCKAIVENLMKFARAEKIVLEPTNLAQVVQDTINLVEHQVTLSGCKIFKDFQPCPLVNANGNQLQQVLLNIIVNASHALENCAKKNIIVRTLQVGNKAQIQIEDTGSGIPPEVQKKIFEPFFTTKPAGKGTGLGLSVSIGIVKDHKGEISLKSEMNQGTTFFIDIPIPEMAKLPTQPLENTHGGAYLTADAKALEDSKVFEKKMASAPEQKPTELNNAISTKQIDKALDDFDARKNKQVKPVAATPPLPKPEVSKVVAEAVKEKPEIAKVKTPKIETPKVEVKSETAKIELPKVELPKIDLPKVELPKKDLPGIPLPNIPVHKAATEVKAATEIKPKTIDLPLPTTPSRPVLKIVEVPKVAIEKAGIEKTVIQKPVVQTVEKKAAQASAAGAFKVTINKPKLKS